MFQGMKMSPRFREGTAYVKTRHQPPHMKYPLIGFHVVANVQVYSAEQLNMKEDVCTGVYNTLTLIHEIAHDIIDTPYCLY